MEAEIGEMVLGTRNQGSGEGQIPFGTCRGNQTY